MQLGLDIIVSLTSAHARQEMLSIMELRTDNCDWDSVVWQTQDLDSFVMLHLGCLLLINSLAHIPYTVPAVFVNGSWFLDAKA